MPTTMENNDDLPDDIKRIIEALREVRAELKQKAS